MTGKGNYSDNTTGFIKSRAMSTWCSFMNIFTGMMVTGWAPPTKPDGLRW